MSGIIGTSKSKSGVIGRSKDTAKAWVKFDGQGSSDLTINSFGVSSVDYRATGIYRVNFTSSMANVNYAVAGHNYNDNGTSPQILFSSTSGTAPNVAYHEVCTCWNSSDTLVDGYDIYLIYFGD